MIRFPCHCRHTFEVADDMAGGLLQCPNCGRLNDVPTLNDLANLAADGTYTVDAAATADVTPDTLGRLEKAYAKTKVDAYGRDIDLRGPVGDPAQIGAEAVPLELKDSVRPGAPKYDPATGELIRPMPLRQEQGPAAQQRDIPLAKRVNRLRYAAGDTAESRPSHIFLALFTATNLTVMGFVFLAHVLLLLIGLVASVAYFPIIVFFVIAFILLGHYGNVVDETATEAKDELPRPLRDLRWHEDLWGPFFQVVLSLALAYGWSIAALFLEGVEPTVRLGLAGVGLVFGTIAFPAILLTATTSGTILNMRPDRVFGVARRLGLNYLAAVLAWVVAGGAYLMAMAGTTASTIALFTAPATGAWAVVLHPLASFPLLMVAIYLMHAFCWFLGLQYRTHHHEFPWVLQRYVGKKPPAPSEGFTVLPPIGAVPVPHAQPAPAPVPVQPVPALPVLPAEPQRSE